MPESLPYALSLVKDLLNFELCQLDMERSILENSPEDIAKMTADMNKLHNKQSVIIKAFNAINELKIVYGLR